MATIVYGTILPEYNFLFWKLQYSEWWYLQYRDILWVPRTTTSFINVQTLGIVRTKQDCSNEIDVSTLHIPTEWWSLFISNPLWIGGIIEYILCIQCVTVIPKEFLSHANYIVLHIPGYNIRVYTYCVEYLTQAIYFCKTRRSQMLSSNCWTLQTTTDHPSKLSFLFRFLFTPKLEVTNITLRGMVKTRALITQDVLAEMWHLANLSPGDRRNEFGKLYLAIIYNLETCTVHVFLFTLMSLNCIWVSDFTYWWYNSTSIQLHSGGEMLMLPPPVFEVAEGSKGKLMSTKYMFHKFSLWKMLHG